MVKEWQLGQVKEYVGLQVQEISFRGSLFFRTPFTSEGGKLSYLNNMMGVFEYEVDELGNCSAKTWE
jgi:hypothetical protein